jgi:hypothetical protein
MFVFMRSFTNRFLAPAAGWAAALALLFGASPGATATAAGPSAQSRGNLKVHADGPSNCNCTGSDAQLTVCHVTNIDVSIGGSTINVSTGQSDSSCGSKTVPDGRCIYYRYNFECERTIFWGWDCWFVGTGLKERPATEDDC